MIFKALASYISFLEVLIVEAWYEIRKNKNWYFKAISKSIMLNGRVSTLKFQLFQKKLIYSSLKSP